jgi:hypothetical protein
MQQDLGNLQRDLNNRQRLLQNALAERDRACAERDRHELEYEEALVSRRKIEDQRAKEVEEKHRKIIDDLHRQLSFKEDQLNGKRAVWLDSHSSARRLTASLDPFATPKTNRVSKTKIGTFLPPTNTTSAKLLKVPPTNTTGSQLLKDMESKNDAQAQFQLSDLSFSAGLPHEYWPYYHPDQAPENESMKAENGSDVNHTKSAGNFTDTSEELDDMTESDPQDTQELVAYKTEDQIAAEFREEFEETYARIEKWVGKYANNVNPIEFDHYVSHDEDVWPFLASLTYDDAEQAHEHSILLLRNPATRPFFVMRYIVQLLHNFIWNASSFCFPEMTDTKLRSLLLANEQRLMVRG